jgi:hypothetical protein
MKIAVIRNVHELPCPSAACVRSDAESKIAINVVILHSPAIAISLLLPLRKCNVRREGHQQKGQRLFHHIEEVEDFGLLFKFVLQ